eukprot:7929931-Ditylum_brightwellii.AAC.1
MQNFSQAKGTPFTVNQLVFFFGELEEKPVGQQFKNGMLDLTTLDVDQYTKAFLEELQHTPGN